MKPFLYPHQQPEDLKNGLHPARILEISSVLYYLLIPKMHLQMSKKSIPELAGFHMGILGGMSTFLWFSDKKRNLQAHIESTASGEAGRQTFALTDLAFSSWSLGFLFYNIHACVHSYFPLLYIHTHTHSNSCQDGDCRHIYLTAPTTPLLLSALMETTKH